MERLVDPCWWLGHTGMAPKAAPRSLPAGPVLPSGSLPRAPRQRTCTAGCLESASRRMGAMAR